MEKEIAFDIISPFFVLGFYMGIFRDIASDLLLNISFKNVPLIYKNKLKFCLSMFYYFKFNYSLSKHLSIFLSLQ